MKRIRIWINSFNLFQQVVALAFFMITFFVIFFNTYLDGAVDLFINSRLYNEIDQVQEKYVANQITNDGRIITYVYNLEKDDFEIPVKEEDAAVFSNINLHVTSDTKRMIATEHGKITYSIKHINQNSEFVSYANPAYREMYRLSLLEMMVNALLLATGGIFLIFFLWIFTLIAPLNQLKGYILKIKNGEEANLNIKRRDEIGEVADALVDMHRELEEQNRIKEEMIQNISHDLKTPIATIKSYSESIKDGIYPYGSLEKSVDVIIEHANRLEKKVYSLLTLNKIGYLVDAGENVNANMSKVVRQALLSTKVLRNDIQIKTELDEDVFFHGEEEHWRTVIENLLDNAIRYAKTTVTISVEENLLEVFDDGNLMSKERIDKLFKPYEKGNKGKFGLGLSIVKKITETYGYKVVGENMDNGVVFRIWNAAAKKANKKSK